MSRVLLSNKTAQWAWQKKSFLGKMMKLKTYWLWYKFVSRKLYSQGAGLSGYNNGTDINLERGQNISAIRKGSMF